MSLSKLVIFDASCYLWAGTKSEQGKHVRHYGFAKGGIDKLMHAIFYELFNSQGTGVIVSFDSKTERKNYIPGYKGNRTPDAEVYMQEKVLYPALQQMNIQVLKEDGCESDDLIHRAVEQNYSLFDKIVIKTNDMDLTACIDESGKVEIQTPTSISYNVERKTFEKVLASTSTSKDVVKRWVTKDVEIEPVTDVKRYGMDVVISDDVPIVFNSVTPFKVFFGDKSDNIPEFRCTKNVMYVYKFFISWVHQKEGSFHTASHVDHMIQFYQENPLELSDEELDDLYNRIMVFYPTLPTTDCTYDFNLQVNTDKMIEFAQCYNIRFILEYFKVRLKTPNSQINLLKQMAMQVKSGSVAVDYDLQVNQAIPVVDEKMENLDVFLGSSVGEY